METSKKRQIPTTNACANFSFRGLRKKSFTVLNCVCYVMFIWWFVLGYIICTVLRGNYCVIGHSCCNIYTNTTIIIVLLLLCYCVSPPPSRRALNNNRRHIRRQTNHMNLWRSNFQLVSPPAQQQRHSCATVCRFCYDLVAGSVIHASFSYFLTVFLVPRQIILKLDTW